MGTKGNGGEIVQVEGGHIVRESGRKDRHSKVYTAKGPRDRRVRLSAHTAIQFYDVQDRLGYDRPSMAVDWLIKKAKSAIDKLAELPPWHPTPPSVDQEIGPEEITLPEQDNSSGYSFQVTNNSTTFLPPSMEPFFPTSSSSSSMNFQGYPIEDLGLSLHSFHGQSNPTAVPSIEQTLYHPSVDGGFDGTFPRIGSWSGDENRASVGFGLNPMQMEHHHQQQDGHSSRGALQAGFLQPFRPWNALPMTTADQSKLHGISQPFAFASSASLHNHGRTIVSDTPTSSSPNSHQ